MILMYRYMYMYVALVIAGTVLGTGRESLDHIHARRSTMRRVKSGFSCDEYQVTTGISYPGRLRTDGRAERAATGKCSAVHVYM